MCPKLTILQVFSILWLKCTLFPFAFRKDFCCQDHCWTSLRFAYRPPYPRTFPFLLLVEKFFIVTLRCWVLLDGLLYSILIQFMKLILFLFTLMSLYVMKDRYIFASKQAIEEAFKFVLDHRKTQLKINWSGHYTFSMWRRDSCFLYQYKCTCVCCYINATFMHGLHFIILTAVYPFWVFFPLILCTEQWLILDIWWSFDVNITTGKQLS